ncbi:MAG TPA: sulfotransferase family 2 domain-containing protein [Opitutaceae bacterium]|jgi:hypothetical protein
MLISHPHHFIFFAAGRTGTTSIEQCLRPYADTYVLTAEEERKYSKHLPPAVALARLQPQIWNGYFKVAFVRNPWDWMVSRHFHDRLRRGETGEVSEIKVSDIQRLCRMRGVRRAISWSPYRTQYSFLSGPEGRIIVDFVGRYERLQEDFDEICRQAAIPQQVLPHLNPTLRGCYRDYFRPQSMRLVEQLYWQDISFFGYHF